MPLHTRERPPLFTGDRKTGRWRELVTGEPTHSRIDPKLVEPQPNQSRRGHREGVPAGVDAGGPVIGVDGRAGCRSGVE